MNTREVKEAIRSGYFDNDLGELEHEIDLRKERRARRLLNELDYGDVVRIHGLGMGAKYLNGAMARIVDVKQKRVSVVVTEMPRRPAWEAPKRFQVGSKIIMYPSNLEKVQITEGLAKPGLEALPSRFVDSEVDGVTIINVTPDA